MKNIDDVEFWLAIFAVIIVSLGIILACVSSGESGSYNISYEKGTYSETTQKTYSSGRYSGFHGTRPDSAAEVMERQAAAVKCDVCGMHSDNGVNSACDSCRAKGYH